MHKHSVLEEDVQNAVWFFEEIEGLRASCDRRMTHLARRRLCGACNAFYYPRVARTKCPDCGKKLRSVDKVMTCPECGYKAAELGCRCGEKDRWTPAPREDIYVKGTTLPGLVVLEDALEEKVIALMKQHPLWDWAEAVKGLGATSVARVIARCDIERVKTTSSFWAHFGVGLGRQCGKCKHFWMVNVDTCPECHSADVKSGVPQRKFRGQTLTYDPQAQSVLYLLGVSLQQQRDKYYEFFLNWKGQYQKEGLADGLANSRAFRNMRKLVLAHIYEMWRRGVGLPFSEPYAFTILANPHSLENKIKPGDMVQQRVKTGRRARSGEPGNKRHQLL